MRTGNSGDLPHEFPGIFTLVPLCRKISAQIFTSPTHFGKVISEISGEFLGLRTVRDWMRQTCTEACSVHKTLSDHG